MALEPPVLCPRADASADHDQLVEMFLKRMQRITTAAHEHLHELQDQHRELEEQMLAVFAEAVLDEALLTPEDDPALGEGGPAHLDHAWVGLRRRCARTMTRCPRITTTITAP